MSVASYLWTALVMVTISAIISLSERALLKIERNNIAFERARELVLAAAESIDGINAQTRNEVVEHLLAVPPATEHNEKCLVLDESVRLWYSTFNDENAMIDGKRPGIALDGAQGLSAFRNLVEQAKVRRPLPVIVKLGEIDPVNHVAWGRSIGQGLMLACAASFS